MLSRFVAAIEDLDDDAVIVKITCDKLLPEGSFADFAMDTLLQNNVDYVGPQFGEGALRHGLSVEPSEPARFVPSTVRHTPPTNASTITIALGQARRRSGARAVVGASRSTGCAGGEV
ncbi:MAG: hypothetical protein WD690_00285 [Vicinamibacterales bacterium]